MTEYRVTGAVFSPLGLLNRRVGWVGGRFLRLEPIKVYMHEKF